LLSEFAAATSGSRRLAHAPRRAPHGFRLLAQVHLRFDWIVYSGACDGFRITNKPHREARHRSRDHEIENLRSIPLKPIQVCVERVVHKDITRFGT
jgi:hypothetical protein